MLVGDMALHIDLDNSKPGRRSPSCTAGPTCSAPTRWAAACSQAHRGLPHHAVGRGSRVVISAVSSVIGMWAGFYRGWRETVAMRVADVIMSFPSLLLAVVVLYVFSSSAANIVAVLAITRIPVYLRTARAESAELSSRVFVDAARTFGASRTVHHHQHVLPIRVADAADGRHPGLLLRHARGELLELPWHRYPAADVSWGLMVSQGRSTCTPPGGCRSSRPGHRHHHRLGHHPRRMGADRRRPRATLAPDGPAETSVPLHQDRKAL